MARSCHIQYRDLKGTTLVKKNGFLTEWWIEQPKISDPKPSIISTPTFPFVIVNGTSLEDT